MKQHRSIATVLRHLLLVTLVSVLGSGLSQGIGDDHASFLDATGAVVEGESFRIGSFVMQTQQLGGLLASVTMQGTLDEVGIADASSALAIATGYGESIREPLAQFLRDRATQLVGQGPVAVGVEAYRLELNVTQEGPAVAPDVRLALEIPRIPDEAFGEAASRLGAEDAQVVIRMFSDFECPYCKQYAAQVLPALKQQILQTDDVAFALHHFPLNNIHPNAEPAAVATQCVQDQFGADAFWPYHDLLFERQSAWGALGDPYPYFVRLLGEVPSVVAAAGTVAAAEQAVEGCIDDGAALAFVRSATQTAVAIGVQGTPTVFVGGYRLSNFGDPAAYARLIALERAWVLSQASASE